MATGTWTTGEARERAAFVLGVAPDASTAEARSSYRRQLRLFAGDDEHARAARRTLMAAWAVWHDTVPELRLMADAPDVGEDRVGVLELARAERERRLADEEAARGDERPPDGAGGVEVLEVLRDEGRQGDTSSLEPRGRRSVGTVIGVWRPVVGGVGFVVDDAHAHRAYGEGVATTADADVSVHA